MLKNLKKFWNNHKGLVITAGIGVGVGLCYLVLSKGTKEKGIEDINGDKVELGDFECLVDGERKPIYENGDETRIYDYAFANDQVREEFRELGYTIVESS